MILSLLFILSQTHKIKIETPQGEISISVQGQEITSGSIKESIEERLEKLEELIPGVGEKMTRIRRRRILRLIEEIYGLVEVLPEEAEVSLEVNAEEEKEEEHVIYPMSQEAFNALLSQLEEEGFSDARLEIVISAASTNYFTVEQVCRILDEFSMDEDKLSALKVLWPRVLDPENKFKILQKFVFSDSKERAREIME